MSKAKSCDSFEDRVMDELAGLLRKANTEGHLAALKEAAQRIATAHVKIDSMKKLLDSTAKEEPHVSRGRCPHCRQEIVPEYPYCKCDAQAEKGGE